MHWACKYVLNPLLVRGLDYYSHTVFEWVTTELGSQGAVCSGGRYDGLVEQLGGDSTPAIGWALGQERIVDLIKVPEWRSAGAGPGCVLRGCRSAGRGRRAANCRAAARPNPRLAHRDELRRWQFQVAAEAPDKSGAAWALILGDSETEQRVAGLEVLRVEAPQVEVAWERLVDELGTRLTSADPGLSFHSYYNSRRQVMVEEYLTDRDQEEALRNWWRENWSWILGGIVLGLVLLGGWQYWKSPHRESGGRGGQAVRRFSWRAGPQGRGRGESHAEHARGRSQEVAVYAAEPLVAGARSTSRTAKYDEALPLLRGRGR